MKVLIGLVLVLVVGGGKHLQLLLRPTKVWSGLIIFTFPVGGWENKVNSYSDQLKFGQVCKFGVEFDNKWST